MKKSWLFIAMLIMVLIVAVPAMAQMLEDPALGSGNATTEQYPPVTGLCEHVPGEFIVGFESEEAMLAAPQENVVATNPLPPYVFLQLLAFEDIANIVDPVEQRNAEEARRQSLFAIPGWKYVDYNCVGTGAGLMAPGTAGGDNTIQGTDEGETLQGTEANDLIWAGGGGDTVLGGGGHDVIHVEGDTSYDYRDTVSCGPGYDTVYTDSGYDWEWDGDGLFGDDCENWPPIETKPPDQPGGTSQEPTT